MAVKGLKLQCTPKSMLKNGGIIKKTFEFCFVPSNQFSIQYIVSVVLKLQCTPKSMLKNAEIKKTFEFCFVPSYLSIILISNYVPLQSNTYSCTIEYCS